MRTRLSQSHGPPTSPPHQRAHSRLSFWHRSRPHGATEPDTHNRSHPLSWTRSIVSGMLRRQDRSDIELQEPPVVEVPYTAGKPVCVFSRILILIIDSFSRRGTITQERRSQIPVHLDLPRLITPNNTVEQRRTHYRHSHHRPLPLPILMPL